MSAEERAAAKADREAEIKAERAAKFATIDKDGDSKVTLAEIQALPKPGRLPLRIGHSGRPLSSALPADGNSWIRPGHQPTRRGQEGDQSS